MTVQLPALVGCCHVSTIQQGQNGFALDGQRLAAISYAASRPLLGDFIEVKSNLPSHLVDTLPTASRIGVDQIGKQSHPVEPGTRFETMTGVTLPQMEAQG